MKTQLLKRSQEVNKMELNQIKNIATKVLKVGKKRVKIRKPEESMQAMTKEDVRALRRAGAIEKMPKKGVSKVRAKKIAAQKKKGRKRGTGTKKGAIGARVKKKEVWMKKIRSQRRFMKEIKPKLKKDAYRKLYLMCKGGYFRNKTHLNLYIKEKKLWKETKKG